MTVPRSMLLTRARLSGFTLALLLGMRAEQATAQNPTQTARAFVASPVALGMGDAAVAAAMRTGAFFYNPAALVLLPADRPYRFEAGGHLGTPRMARPSAPYTYLRERLLPAVRTGLQALPPAQRRALFNEANALGTGRTSESSGFMASLTRRSGAFGWGSGLYVHGFRASQVRSGGGGIPELVLREQHEASMLVSGAFDFSAYGMRGLSLGATLKGQRRVIASKAKALDAFAPDEGLFFQRATAVGIDLAGLYRTRLGRGPGQLRAGVALYDAASTGFEYVPHRVRGLGAPIPGDSVGGQQARWKPLEGTERRRVQQEFELTPSVRAGVAMSVPSLFGRLGETTVAVDLQHYTRPGRSRSLSVDPAFATRLHAGAQVDVHPALSLRAGLSQGYPCAGLTLRLRGLHLDYAWSGQEDGRRPGEAPVWQHTLNLGVQL